MNRRSAIERSMLWSAYGDALGFITELADERGVAVRTGGVTRVEHLIPWRRRVGGKYGETLNLPTGIYSDDTQLRLATCRCIRNGGAFDAEAFAKVELTVFLSYCLGAGLSTKAAAESLRKQNIQWNTNFFESGRTSYLKAGGNGAAMRVQPHVWAFPESGKISDLLLGVVQNTIVSHGHSEALIGACFHALTLHRTLLRGGILPPQEWPGIVEELRDLSTYVQSDEELNTMWLPAWERLSGQSFANVCSKALTEFMVDIQRAISRINLTDRESNLAVTYHDFAAELGCFNRNFMGSSTKTALLANLVSHLYSVDPHKGIVTAANALGSDTDTIATMAAAIMGVVTDRPPPEDLLDQEYLLEQAHRLADIGMAKEVVNHPYPDLSVWKPPRTNVDSVGLDGQAMYLKGFGKLNPLAAPVGEERDRRTVWQKCRLPWGQTVIVQRRVEPAEISYTDRPILLQKPTTMQRPSPAVSDAKDSMSKEDSSQRSLFSGVSPGGKLSLQKPAGMEECSGQITRSSLESLAKHGYPASDLGEELRSRALSADGIESAVHFACEAVRAMRNERGITYSVNIKKRNLHEMTADAISGGLRSNSIGQHLRQLAVSGVTDEIVGAYTGIIAKAIIYRRNKHDRNLVTLIQLSKKEQ